MANGRAIPQVIWPKVTRAKTWADYECPVCGGIERVSSFVDLPVTHRHRYADGPLQTGVVFLTAVRP